MEPTKPDPNNQVDAAHSRVEGLARVIGTPRVERWFYSLVQNSSDIITLLEADGTIRYQSPSIERILGYHPEELVGDNAFHYVHPEDLERVETAFSEGLEDPRRRPSAEYRFRHKDGSWVWLESVGTNLLDDPGVGEYVVNSRDVTERKQAEEALKESEDRLRVLFENSSDLISLINPDNTFRYISPPVRQLLGYEPEELEGTVVSDLVHPQDFERFGRKIVEQIQSGISPSNPIEGRYRHKNGSWRHLETTFNIMIDDPSVRGVICSTRDVTERKKAEEQLKQSEERYRAVIEQTIEGIYLGAADTKRVLESNPAFQNMLGYTAEELCGMHIYEFVAHDQGNIDCIFQSVLDRGHRLIGERRYRRKDGSIADVETSATVISYDNREVLCTVVRDITERKRTEEALRRSESSLATAQRIAHLGNWDYDITNDEAQWSDEMYRIFGFSPRQFVPRYRTFLNSVHPEDRDLIRRSVRKALYEEKQGSVDYRVVRPDGEIRIVQSQYEVVRDISDRAVKLVGTVHDITERKQAEEEKSRQARHAALRADISAILARGDTHDGHGTLYGILQRCTECMVQHLNAAFARIWTLDEEEDVLGLQASAGMYTHLDGPHSRVPVGEYKIGLIAKERMAHLTNDVLNDPRVSDKEWAEREGMVAFAGYPLIVEGRLVGVMAMFAREPLEEDTIGALASVADVIAQGIKRKLVEERLEHQALHDSLTGLPNRQLFVDRLGQALMRIRRQQCRVAVLFMDLDGFKVVNDSLGHDVGDWLLVAVAERLKGCLRPEETLARFGGDEFIVLVEEVEGADNALRVTQRITEEFQRPFVLDGRNFVVRFSIGVALGEADTKSPEELLRDADIAMYRAKVDAVDYRVFDPGMYEQAVGRLELENDLRRALDKAEFTLYYQPKFHLLGQQQDRIEGFEALLRWEHPEKGFMLPGEFLSLAEETGLIITIGGWVMKEACRQAKEWQERYPSEPPLAMCVNLSAAQVRHPGLLKDVRAALLESGLEPGSLILEITEGTLLKDTEVIETVFKELKALAVRLTIDDFGKEYSSLSYLNRLPVDALKIDRSFLESFGENPSNTIIVEAVVSLAHSLGLEVTGEGVESAEQLELLRGMGCDFAQGYHLARPLPPEDASEFLVT